MSANMASTSARYENAAKAFDDAYNKYAGEEGLKLATKYGTEQAEEQSMRAGSVAGANAMRAARNAGMTKAQAAMMGQQAASDASANAYQNIYDSSRQASLNAGNTALGTRGQQLTGAQQEGQNAYNRFWGNVGSIGSMVQSVVSDERLKEADNVSSDSNNGSKEESWTLLKVCYPKPKKEDK
jgi:hypothetical protein